MCVPSYLLIGCAPCEPCWQGLDLELILRDHLATSLIRKVPFQLHVIEHNVSISGVHPQNKAERASRYQGSQHAAAVMLISCPQSGDTCHGCPPG